MNAYVMITKFTNGQIGLMYPPETQDPEVAYRRACEDNKGNITVETLTLVQVLRVTSMALSDHLCRILRSYTENKSLCMEAKCATCDFEFKVYPREGWMVTNPGFGLPKHCSECGVKFTGWGT